MDGTRVFELIERYEIITIFRHVSPDSDALGSQFGLKQWIIDQYPNKQVYALGYDKSSKEQYFPPMDTVTNDNITKSLAIVLDTANSARIDDARWKLAQCKIKIDHHIIVEQYGDIELVDDLFGATCEILTYLFEKNGCTLSACAAQYLYGGLIADTLRFSISTIKPRTFRLAAYLLEAGVDVAKANEENFSTSLKLYRFETYLRDSFIQKENVAYSILYKEDYERFSLSFHEAKEKVFIMSGVHEFEAWALFIENGVDEAGHVLFNGSLRSKRKTINDIANKYGGGGHRFACGVKGLTLDKIEALIQDIYERVHP